MAEMILLPNGTGAVATQWIAVGESTHHECLDDDNDDTSYAKCSANGRTMIIEYADPSVAEADLASITRIRFLSSGRAVHRTDPSIVDIAFYSATDHSGYEETASYNAHRSSYETINGNFRTTSFETSTDWTYEELEDIRMLCTKDGTVQANLSYLAIEVTYVAAAADNATFFGANF